jgi:hypothetical protein
VEVAAVQLVANKDGVRVLLDLLGGLEEAICGPIMNDFTSLLKPMVDALAGRNQKIIC